MKARWPIFLAFAIFFAFVWPTPYDQHGYGYDGRRGTNRITSLFWESNAPISHRSPAWYVAWLGIGAAIGYVLSMVVSRALPPKDEENRVGSMDSPNPSFAPPRAKRGVENSTSNSGMFCIDCGTRNPERARYCYACGTALAGPTIEAPLSPPEPPQPEPVVFSAPVPSTSATAREPASLQPTERVEFSYGKFEISPEKPASPEEISLLQQKRSKREIRGALRGLGRGIGWSLALGLVLSLRYVGTPGLAASGLLSLVILICSAAGIWLTTLLWRTRGPAREEWTWIGLGMMFWVGLVLVAAGILMVAASNKGNADSGDLLTGLIPEAVGGLLLYSSFRLARTAAIVWRSLDRTW